MGGLFQDELGAVANKPTVASDNKQAPAPKGAANGRPTIGPAGASPAPKAAPTSARDSEADSQPGGFLSGTARGKAISDAKLRVGLAHTNYQIAITQLKVAEMIKKDDELGAFASMLIGVVFGNLTTCVLGAMKVLSTVHGAQTAIEELGEKSSSELVKSVTAGVSEKSLENTIGVALDVAKDRTKGALKSEEQAEKKEDPNAGAGDAKTQPQKYLTALETTGSIKFQALGESADSLDDNSLLAFKEAMHVARHTVEIYKEQIKQQLDRYMASNASKIGRYDVSIGPRGSLEEMRVAWINFSSGKRLVYVTRDFDRNEVERADLDGNKSYEGEKAPSYSDSAKIKSLYKLDRFDGFVGPNMVETAIERHRATWRDEPREYPAEMLTLLTGINAGTPQNPVHVPGFYPPEGEDKKHGWY